jgi:hypothetical protein
MPVRYILHAPTELTNFLHEETWLSALVPSADETSRN